MSLSFLDWMVGLLLLMGVLVWVLVWFMLMMLLLWVLVWVLLRHRLSRGPL
jgi:hypothetical protein